MLLNGASFAILCRIQNFGCINDVIVFVFVCQVKGEQNELKSVITKGKLNFTKGLINV